METMSFRYPHWCFQINLAYRSGAAHPRLIIVCVSKTTESVAFDTQIVIMKRLLLLAKVVVGPAAQLSLGLLPGQRAPVQAQLFEIPPCAADIRTGLEPEQLHDRVTVQVRSYRGQVLLGADPLDAPFQVVVGALQRHRLAAVTGGAVGADQF